MGGCVDLQSVGRRWEKDPLRVWILVRDTSEKVELIHKFLLTTHSRQKSYADRRRRPLKFEVGNHVFSEVVRFRKRGKLSPRYIGTL